MVHIDPVAEMFGAALHWTSEAVTLTWAGVSVAIDAGADFMRVIREGTEEIVPLAAPPIISQGHWLYPMEAILRAFGICMSWDASARTIDVAITPPVSVPAPTPAPTPASEEYGADLKTTPSLSGRVVILDAGHGLGADNVFRGYSEQATMLNLAFRIKPLLEDLGATVLLTRNTPVYVPLFARPALINKWTLQALREVSGCAEEIAKIDRLIFVMEKIISNPEYYAPIYMNAPFDLTRRRAIHPDMRQIFYLQNNPLIYQNFLAISLHSDANPNTSVNGAYIYIISNTTYNNINYFNNYTNFERSWLFADLLLDRIDPLGISRRQIYSGSAFALIREHNIPAALVENGFHTNPRDRAKLMCDVFLQNLAEAYVCAISEYFYKLGIAATAQPAQRADITVTHNGAEIVFANPPLVRYGFTFFQVDEILNALADSIEWDGYTRIISGRLGENRVEVQIRDMLYIVNGETLSHRAELAPFADNGLVYVYIDFIVAGLGLSAVWDGETRTFDIRSLEASPRAAQIIRQP